MLEPECARRYWSNQFHKITYRITDPFLTDMDILSNPAYGLSKQSIFFRLTIQASKNINIFSHCTIAKLRDHKRSANHEQTNRLLDLEGFKFFSQELEVSNNLLFVHIIFPIHRKRKHSVEKCCAILFISLFHLTYFLYKIVLLLYSSLVLP